jgi:hypothetical protein
MDTIVQEQREAAEVHRTVRECVNWMCCVFFLCVISFPQARKYLVSIAKPGQDHAQILNYLSTFQEGTDIMGLKVY